MSIHYALRPEVDESTFLGGVLAAGDASIDVRPEALAESGGVIVIADDDHLKAAVLDGYQPLQRVPAPEVLNDVTTAPATSEPREGVSAPADGVLRDVSVSEPSTASDDVAAQSTSGTAPSRSASRTDKKES
jgi:hypothetical protein